MAVKLYSASCSPIYLISRFVRGKNENDIPDIIVAHVCNGFLLPWGPKVLFNPPGHGVGGTGNIVDCHFTEPIVNVVASRNQGESTAGV